MTRRNLAVLSLLFAGLASPLAAQSAGSSARARSVAVAAAKGHEDDATDALYDQARDAIENDQFDRAVDGLNQLITRMNVRTDAALYWKAYSQAKLALSTEALETIRELVKQFGSSPWVKDAKALEVELRQANGQPVAAELQNDEELKLLALRGLMQSDPDKALPIIEKMLASGATPRIRDRAMFVLSQSRSARAHDIMAAAARNNANPEVQLRAIRYLGLMGTGADRELLADVYRTATAAPVKHAILQSYFMTGNVEKLSELAKTETDPALRQTAIRNLGLTSRPGSAEALIALYGPDAPTDVRRAVVGGLFLQRNAKALVELARGEKDPRMKQEIVSKLSLMKSPEATDYLLELLK